MSADSIKMEGSVCPVPLQHEQKIVVGHGSGGRMTARLIAQRFLPAFDNEALAKGDDAGVVELAEAGRIAVSTDAHIVVPLFFPGGDIGSLAVCGTVNDLAMVGAQPRWLTASFILEEGLAMTSLEAVIASMQAAAREAGVTIIAGDTKVAEHGKVDGMFISTAGVGWVPPGRCISGAGAQPGDVVLLSGTLGDHGIAVLAARGDLEFEVELESDIAPLNSMVEAILAAASGVHVLRDPTRGGLATTLNEIAFQSGVTIRLKENELPLRPAVSAACEMLGFDPLYVANEGKLTAIVAPEDAEQALAAMQHSPYGSDACVIGQVEEGPAQVVMETVIGGTRIVDVLAGEMLPRIC